MKWAKTVEELVSIWLWVHLCQGSKLIQANWAYNVDREASAHISFHLAKLDPGTHFPLQRQSSLPHLVFYHCSRRISNSKQSSEEIDSFWSRDCNQNKTVRYTGTIQPKTQPSIEGVKLCRWYCRGRGGKWFIYTFPANAKESFNWLTGTIWALLERFTSLWIQQCIIPYNSDQVLFITNSCIWARYWTDRY